MSTLRSPRTRIAASVAKALADHRQGKRDPLEAAVLRELRLCKGGLPKAERDPFAGQRGAT